MLTFTITIHPIGRGQFDAYHGERFLCTSRVPLCEASRVLLASGLASPRDRIEMWHEGASYAAMCGNIGWAARHTVEDSPLYGPMFRRMTVEASSSPVGASNDATRYTPRFA